VPSSDEYARFTGADWMTPRARQLLSPILPLVADAPPTPPYCRALRQISGTKRQSPTKLSAASSLASSLSVVVNRVSTRITHTTESVGCHRNCLRDVIGIDDMMWGRTIRLRVHPSSIAEDPCWELGRASICAMAVIPGQCRSHVIDVNAHRGVRVNAEPHQSNQSSPPRFNGSSRPEAVLLRITEETAGQRRIRPRPWRCTLTQLPQFRFEQC